MSEKSLDFTDVTMNYCDMNKRSGEETRSHILTAALRVFVDQGYAGTSIRTIANAAEVSVGTLYLYFKSKEELYCTIIRDSLDEFSLMTERALENVTSPVAAISTVISMTIRYTRSHRELILLQGREGGIASCAEMKGDFFKKRRRLLESMIAKGVEDGVFKPCNVGEAAKVIINLLRGIVVSVIVEEDAIPSADESSSFILNGLLKKDS